MNILDRAPEFSKLAAGQSKFRKEEEDVAEKARGAELAGMRVADRD